MKTIQERFWSKVDKTTTPDGCWEWIGARNGDGYGRLRIREEDGGGQRCEKRAHRLSWELHFGAIPEGLLVCHHCDNPPCSRPDHLFLGTKHDNLQDSYDKGRPLQGLGALKGLSEQHPNAKLTSRDVIEIRQSTDKQIRLAEKYGVSPALICGILAGTRWRSTWL